MVDTPTFSLAQVRRVLMVTLNIHPAKERTFEARLQQLQKLGLPPGTNVGRGAPAKYHYWQLAELDAYFAFLDAGASPALLRAHFADRPLFEPGSGVDGAFAERASPTQQDDIHVAMRFNALGSLRSGDPGRQKPTVFDREFPSGPGRTIFKALHRKESEGDMPAIVFDVSQRLRALRRAVELTVPECAAAPFYPRELGWPHA